MDNDIQKANKTFLLVLLQNLYKKYYINVYKELE